jgi:hypothetical protein
MVWKGLMFDFLKGIPPQSNEYSMDILPSRSSGISRVIDGAGILVTD